MKKYVSFFLLMIVAVRLDAQEFKTDQSIASQLKNNSQPGMRYAPVVTAAPQVKPHGTMVEEIRKGKFGRVQFPPAAVQAIPSPPAAASKAAALPSNTTAEQSGQQLKSSEKTPVVQPIPSQEGKPSSGAESAAMLRTPGSALKKVQR